MMTRLTFNPLVYTVAIFSLLLLSMFACKDDEMNVPETMEPDTMEPDTTGGTTDPGEDTYEVNGLMGSSQKGPYLIGSTVTIFELETDLSPTGKSFAEDITNNLGSFEVDNLSLVSSFVELRASGFYYNEVTGDNSEAQLNLNALVDLDNKDAINVNILTTLEQKRVEYLIENGASFVDAKKQALQEVLQIFEIENADIPEAALLNIAQSGEGNAMLLAISAMIQGNNTVGVVSEMISKISNDIEEDGILDDESICDQLSTAANFVNPQIIRTNLEDWYADSGSAITIPNFETYLTQFIQNTPCAVESNITYPEDGFSGLNLLATANTSFQVGESYSMRAVLEKGTSLRVRVVGNNWTMNIGQGDAGWLVGDWDSTREDVDRGRIFTSARTGSIDFKLNLTIPLGNGLYSDEIKFEIYENGSSSPSRIKIINIEGITPAPRAFNNLPLSPQSTTGPSENLLNRLFFFGFPSVNQLDFDYKYGFAVYVPNGFEIELIVQGENFEFSASGFNQGWQIEQIDVQNNIYKLTATGLGYYEAEINLLEGQGCVTIDVETFVNGESINIFNVNNQAEIYFNAPREGAHGDNILFQGNTLEAGDVSLATELDYFKQKNLTVILSGAGWSIPTPIENEKWEIEEYDTSDQSQTFRATFDEMYFDGQNDLKLSIDPFNANNPPEIKVEIYIDIEGCGPQLIESFDVMF